MEQINSTPEIENQIPQQVNSKNHLPLKPLLTIIFIIFLTVLTFQIVIHFNVFKSDNNKTIEPTANNLSTIPPSNTPTIINPISIGGIKLPESVSPKFKPISKKQNIYYLKSNEVWKAGFNDVGKLVKKTVYRPDVKILAFSVSSDEMLLAYIYRKNIYTEMEGPAKGDTVVLVNLGTKTEKEIYSQILEGNQLNGLKFSPDVKQLYFTNSQIHIYDLLNGIYKTIYTDITPFSILCSYKPDVFSTNDRNLLLDYDCWEGGKQVIFDTLNRKTTSEFNNGYIGGGIYVLGFLNDSVLLGYDNRAPLTIPSNPASEIDYDNQTWKLGLYDIQGKLIKSLGVYERGYNYTLINYTDFNSSSEKIYFTLPKEINSKTLNLFELDRKNFEMKEVPLNSDLMWLNVGTTSEDTRAVIQYFDLKSSLITEIDAADSAESVLIIK